MNVFKLVIMGLSGSWWSVLTEVDLDLSAKLIINKPKRVDSLSSHPDNARHFGGVPERPKGSDCKSDAKASLVRIQLPPPVLK